jgi:acyl-CoA thioesterase
MSPLEIAQASAYSMWANDKATQHLKMELILIDVGAATLTMPVQDFMLNGHGTCHGGYLFTLADSAFAFACNSYNQNTVAQSCHITFLKPAFAGDLLYAVAVEQAKQGRSGVYDVVVCNQSQEEIALFRGLSRTIKGEHFKAEAP